MRMLEKFIIPSVCCIISVSLLLLCQFLYLYFKSYSYLAFPKTHVLAEGLNKSNNIEFICPKMTSFRFYLTSKHSIDSNIKGYFELTSGDGKQLYKEAIYIDYKNMNKYKDHLGEYKYPIGSFATDLIKFREASYDMPLFVILKPNGNYQVKIMIDDADEKTLKVVNLTISGSTYKKYLNDYEKKK